MMNKRIKVIFVVVGLSAATLIPISTASAADAAVNCKPAKSTGHSPMKLDIPKIKKPFRDRTITLKTNCGNIVIAAYGTKAPLTVISMSYLANQGYFDKSLCHRMVTNGIFIIQCGDPTATGSGGPQWRYPDENLPDATTNNYPEGIVAMANSGANTNGSQFFINQNPADASGQLSSAKTPNKIIEAYKNGGNPSLDGGYTVFGQVTEGMDVVDKIKDWIKIKSK